MQFFKCNYDIAIYSLQHLAITQFSYQSSPTKLLTFLLYKLLMNSRIFIFKSKFNMKNEIKLKNIYASIIEFTFNIRIENIDRYVSNLLFKNI